MPTREFWDKLKRQEKIQEISQKIASIGVGAFVVAQFFEFLYNSNVIEIFIKNAFSPLFVIFIRKKF